MRSMLPTPAFASRAADAADVSPASDGADDSPASDGADDSPAADGADDSRATDAPDLNTHSPVLTRQSQRTQVLRLCSRSVSTLGVTSSDDWSTVPRDTASGIGAAVLDERWSDQAGQE